MPEYELTEVGPELKDIVIKKRSVSFKNLLNVKFYLLFLFTLFSAFIGISIFIGTTKLYINYMDTIDDMNKELYQIQNIINYSPPNISTWINQQTEGISNVTNLLVDHLIRQPTDFIQESINQFISFIHILDPTSSISPVTIHLNISTIVISKLTFDKWSVELDINVIITILNYIMSIPFYFGLTCLIINLIFIFICLLKGISLFLDYSSNLSYLCKLSFWIGLLLSILFLFLFFSLIYINTLYVSYVGNEIELIQSYIEGNITYYNTILDKGGLVISNFIEDNVNFLIHQTNQIIDDLSKEVQDTINTSLGSSLVLNPDNLQNVDVEIDFDFLKVYSKIIDITWINNKINQIYVFLLLFTGFASLAFIILVIISIFDKS